MEHRIEIQNELKQLSPLLAQRRKENLFFVPENYFNTIEGSVMEKIKSESVQVEIQHSGLKGLEKPEVFNVPYGYFERLPIEILSKTTRKKTLTFWEGATEYFQQSFNISHFFAATPALAVLILAIVVLNKPIEIAENSSSVTQMSNEEISNYLSENISALDESSIVAQLNDNAIGKLSSSIEPENSANDELLIDVSGITLDDIQNL